MQIYCNFFIITDTEKSLFQDQYVTSWITSPSKEPQRHRTISTPTKSSSSASAAEYIKESFIADNDSDKYNVGLSIGSFEKRNGERCLLFILIGRNYVPFFVCIITRNVELNIIKMSWERHTANTVHPSSYILWDQQSPNINSFIMIGEGK